MAGNIRIGRIHSIPSHWWNVWISRHLSHLFPLVTLLHMSLYRCICPHYLLSRRLTAVTIYEFNRITSQLALQEFSAWLRAWCGILEDKWRFKLNKFGTSSYATLLPLFMVRLFEIFVETLRLNVKMVWTFSSVVGKISQNVKLNIEYSMLIMFKFCSPSLMTNWDEN